jgi:hypothetical protein
MPIADTEIQSALTSAQSTGQEFYQKAVLAAHADGYALGEHAAALPAATAAAAEARKGAPQPLTDREARVANWTRLSDQQAASAINALLDAGVDPAVVKAAAEADGFSMPTIRADVRSEEQKIFDASSMAPAGSVADYEIQWFQRSVEPTEPLAQALGVPIIDRTGFHFALDRGLRAGVGAMRFPAALGGALIEQAADDAARYGSMTEVEKTLFDRQQVHDLHSVTGDADRAKADAKMLVDIWRQSNPKLVDGLVKAGWFRSARTVMLLAHQANRLLARSELK